MSQHNVVLLLGSNLGDRNKNIETALKNIEKSGAKIVTKTDIIKTEPIEFVSSNFFCNIALLINTHLSPIKLLIFLKSIEESMGRTADSKEIGFYTDRLIDIDIVSYDNVNYYSRTLEIPHKKHMFEREFSMFLIDELIYRLNPEKHNI